MSFRTVVSSWVLHKELKTSVNALQQPVAKKVKLPEREREGRGSRGKKRDICKKESKRKRKGESKRVKGSH